MWFHKEPSTFIERLVIVEKCSLDYQNVLHTKKESLQIKNTLFGTYKNTWFVATPLKPP